MALERCQKKRTREYSYVQPTTQRAVTSASPPLQPPSTPPGSRLVSSPHNGSTNLTPLSSYPSSPYHNPASPFSTLALTFHSFFPPMAARTSSMTLTQTSHSCCAEA